jgi:hypothetical protein
MIGIEFRGQLGNQMYQYAYIRSVAERNNYDFSTYGTSQNPELFNIFPDIKKYNLPFQYRWHIQEIDYDLKSIFYDLMDNTKVDGFFQNYQYFENQPVKEWFQIKMSEEEKKQADDFIQKYDPSEYCYVHFRGNDFLNAMHITTPPEFYKKAKLMTNNKKYVCITDDIDNAKLYTGIDECYQYNIKTDLYLLTKSKNLIIPMWSSYSFWGGWLSDAECIIAPYNSDKNYIMNNRFTYIKY